jgi:hypothetical protein
VALTAGVVTMTTAWLAVWTALIAHGAAVTNLPGPAQWAIMAGAAAFAHALARSALGERRSRALFVSGVLVLAALLAWVAGFRAWMPLDPRWFPLLGQALAPASARPMVVVPVVDVLALAWLGGRIGGSRLDEHDVARFFIIGLAGLFGAMIVGAMADSGGQLAGAMGLSCALFFATALLVLPLAQLLAVRERAKGASTRQAPFDQRWIPTMIGAVAAILVVAVVLSATASGVLFNAAIAVVDRIPDLLTVVLFPLALVGAGLAEGLIWLLHLLVGQPRTLTLRPHPPIPRPRPHTTLAVIHHTQLPPAIQFALSVSVLIGLGLVVAVVLARTVGRVTGAKADATFAEERETVWSWKAARPRWSVLRGGRRHAASTNGDDLRQPPRTIRQAYRRLLFWGASSGCPRLATETPHEYLGRLRQREAPRERDAALLTSAYVHERYGAAPAPPEEVARALDACGQLEEAFAEAASAAAGRGKSGSEGRAQRRPQKR